MTEPKITNQTTLETTVESTLTRNNVVMKVCLLTAIQKQSGIKHKVPAYELAKENKQMSQYMSCTSAAIQSV